MSNRLFQGLIHQMRDTMDCVIGVVDSTATIIACSELTKIGTTNEFVSLDLNGYMLKMTGNDSVIRVEKKNQKIM